MVQINFAQRQVNAKIVFYGPGMSGKTTNLEIVHQRAPDQNKGELTSISTDGDRTLFFDFMPLDLGTVAGMKTSFQIYTVPGQVYYNSTRKLVLQGVDGVVFVADSSDSMVEENLESFRNLEENLNEYGKSLASLPHVIQFNKRDLPNALPVDEMNTQLNQHGAPTFEAVANSGQGVFPTLKALASAVLESIHQAGGGKAGGQAATHATAAAPKGGMPQGAPPVAPAQQPMQPNKQQPQAKQPAQRGAPTPPPYNPQPAVAQTGFHAPAANQHGGSAAPGGTPNAPRMGGQPNGYAQPAAQVGQTGFHPGAMGQTGFQQPQGGQMQQTGMHPNANLQMASPRQAPNPQQPYGALPATQRSNAQPGSMMNSGGRPGPGGQRPGGQKSLEGTRFRSRAAARSEPRPTPVKRGGGKVYTGIFVAVAVTVGAVLTGVILSFF